VNPRPTYRTLGQARFAWTADRFHSPTHSLRIASTSKGTARWITRVAARPGTKYGLSAWVRAAGAHGRVQLALTFWTKRGEYLAVATKSSPATGARWRRLAVSQVAPARTAVVRIELRQVGSGTSWWDDLALVAAGLPA
jgi:hypothetical protein